MKEKIQSNCDSVIQESFFESATDEQKVRALNIIIDRELEKPENEVDMELVRSCMDTIENIHGCVRERSNKELKENLKRITSSQSERHYSTFKYRRFVRVACVMLIVTVVLSMSVIVMARVARYSSTLEWISDHIEEILGWSSGTHEKDGITIYRGDTSKYYNSIEELLSKEDLDILYPSSLPGGIKLQSVSITEFDGNEFTLTFIFSNDSIGISVYNFDLSSHIFDTEDTVTINGIEYRVSHISEWYQADCVTDKYAYTITSLDYDNLIYLLNSMKEYEE